MEPNGVNGHTVHLTDGPSHINGTHEPTVEELEHALPMVQNDMIPLGELLSSMAQTIYAELSELAETLPNMSDTARKRTLADWVVATKKQVVKLYAVVKWSRDAGIVQKAMNITTFLMEQNNQFLRAQDVLLTHRDTLNAARMRNHDLLTSLDVLTTGSYRRLPSKIKRLIIPPIPLTDDEVKHTLEDVEDAIRFRLRMIEIIPPEMSSYRIADGRVSFFVPKLFEVSLCLRGAKKDDGWFFVNVEFLFNIGGDRTGLQEFPRKPLGILRRHITDEADARLAFYLPLPADQPPLPPGVEIPPRPQLPEGITDAPLVRVYNMLQMMSLSYQLEILWFQAERLRSLGWAEFLTVEMTNSRQTMVVSYWIRKPPSKIPGRQPPPIPLLGGRLTISIVRMPAAKNNKANRSPKARVLAELQEKAKLDVKRPSDEVEPLQFEVKWEPVLNALGISVPAQDVHLSQAELAIDSDNLDFGSLLRKVLAKHSEAILKVIQHQLQNGNETRAMFSPPGEITLAVDEGLLALRTHLCADEVVIVTIEPRTGQLNLRDMGDLAAAGRGRRYAFITAMVNIDPRTLPYRLLVLKRNTIIDNARQKANYIGLQTFSTRNFPPEELSKIGRSREDMLYIQLAKFPNHYLVLVIADEDFRYALISVEVQQNESDMFPKMAMRDVGWLDVKRIHGDEIIVTRADGADGGVVGQKRKRGLHDEGDHLRSIEQYTRRRFNLETHTLREIYAFCCARVAYTKIEQQFKSRSIPYTTVDASNIAKIPELAHVQSTLTRSIPALCVQSSDILSGAPAAEAAMPNIRIIPLHWWSENQAQVVTCVKLKYVQQPIGKRASSSSSIIRPSKRIIYDTTEAIVSFLSEDVDKCVDEFLEEWGRVSKMVVVAREVAQMSQKYRWSDVRLLSFDLQTVEFAYSGDYTVSITCVDQLSLTGGSYELTFSRISDTDTKEQKPPDGGSSYNPHEDLEPYLCTLLRHGRLAASLHTLIALLRDTLPIVLELEDIRSATSRTGDNVDVFPKSAYWFRILYGDLRHALDFRLMTKGRVLIMDGAFSLFAAEDSSGKLVGLNNQSPSKPTPVYRSAPDRAADTSLLLQPIADFPAMISEVLKSVGSAGINGRITPIDIGMICDAPAVRAVGKALHDRIMQRLAR